VSLPSKTHHQVGRAFTIRALDADKHELIFNIALLLEAEALAM
jgi:NADPH-dependent ferric siderophore reductase